MLLMLFTLDMQRYGLHVESVERVVPMLALTPLPHAPEIVSGVFSLGGRTIPVVDLRRRFGLPERPPALADRLILAHTGIRSVALWVDGVEGFLEAAEEEFVRADSVLAGLGQIEGVVTLPNGLILIHDINQCLSLEEEQQLASAMENS